MDMETAVVTGGAGFIGSHICDELIKKGQRVICLDNLVTGTLANIKHLQSDPNFKFIRHDVIQPLPELGDVSYIYHFASPASVPDYQKYQEETALVNSMGTLNMLRLAKKTSAKLLFASTSEVYGDPLVHPQTEDYWGNVNPNGVRACYDESKRFGEAVTALYFRKFNVDARIIRIFNTYGPRMRPNDGRVISNFVNQVLQGKPITVYGDGTQTRSFCYVDDLVRGIIVINTSQKTSGEVYNLGNPDEYTMLELAQVIKKTMDSGAQIEFKPLPEDDPKRRKPDITKVTAQLSWKPTTSLQAGLQKTIEYYRSL